MSHSAVDYKVVTICNRMPQEPYYCLNEWAKSLDGHEPIVLAAIDTHYQGLGDKPKFVYRAIKKGIINSKYIIFCDCWDLVFAAPLDELIELYQVMKSPLVISAEKNCFPADHKEAYDKLPATSSYRYLNSGMIVGETEALLAVLESMDAENIPDDYRMENGNNFHYNDQTLYQQEFLKQPVEIKLDYDQLLCNTLHSVTIDELDFSGERIRNKETGSYPCSFHLNGGAKTGGLREPILQKLKLL